MLSGTPKDWAELGKMRIQLLTTIAALICMWVANHGQWQWMMALHLVLGLVMTSTAAAIINQIIEIDLVNTSFSGGQDTIAVNTAGGSTSYVTSTNYATPSSY